MATEEARVVKDLLARAHDPESAQRIYSDKIQYRPLHLRPSSPPPINRDERRRAREKQRSHRRKALKPKPLSAKQRRKLGLHEVPREGQKYAVFEPLHRLWLGYIREILGHEIFTGGEGAASKLSSADFHGAVVEVVRSGCVSRVGIKGIVIKDTKFVFEIITSKNKLKTVPKESTVFRINIPTPTPTPGTGNINVDVDVDGTWQDGFDENGRKLSFEIHGDQIMIRPSDRSNKKFKSHFSLKL